MADLVPHPLVTQVGLRLAEKGVGVLSDAAQPFLAPFVEEGGQAGPAEFAEAAAVALDDTKYPAEKDALAKGLAEQGDIPDLSLFAGYLGGAVARDGTEWRVLYVDAGLLRWMLVARDDIVAYERFEDQNAPAGVRDALWVVSTASVILGRGARSAQARFLEGEFIEAGDVAAAYRGPSFCGTLDDAVSVQLCYCNKWWTRP